MKVNAMFSPAGTLALLKKSMGDGLRRLTRGFRTGHPSDRLGYTELDLLAALQKEGCPICRLISGSDRRYFFVFFHEGYSQREVLSQLTRSHGFCISHAHHLANRPLGSYPLAVVHQIAAGRLQAGLPASVRPKGRHPGQGPAGFKADICPACRTREQGAERNAFFLAKLLEDPQTLRQYGQPAMLCLPHLRIIAPRLNHAALKQLLRLQETALAGDLPDAGRPPAEAENFQSRSAASLQRVIGHDLGLADYWPLPRQVPAAPTADPVQNLKQDLRCTDMCPVCLALGRSWAAWVGWLDAAARRREKIDDLLPACPQHVWAVLRAAGPELARLTVENVQRLALRQVRMVLSKLDGQPAPPNLRQPVESALRALQGVRPLIRLGREVLGRRANCPLCNHLNTVRDRRLVLLLALLAQSRPRADFESGHGLCLRHFSRTLALAPEARVLEFLVQDQAAKLGVLQWELTEFLRKSAWQARPEPRGGEQVAYIKALVRFSGCLQPPAALEEDAER